VSAGAQVAVLGAGRRGEPVRERRETVRRPLFTLGAFALLGVYGVVRWATMLTPEPIWRLLGLVALSVAIAALGSAIHGRPPELRIPGIVAIVVGAVAVVPVSGFPLRWAVHLRLAVTYRAIRHGMHALPSVIVPYDGVVRWTTPVIVLGAGLLLLGAALTLASARRPVGEARLAGAALPMIVLAIVPASLARPQVAYLQGALLFVLLAALVFSERVAARQGAFAGSLVALATAGALVVAPALDRHTPWVYVTSIAGEQGPPGETFDWSQTYGPLDWPQTGQTVLTVRARFPDYWKAENLDEFNGTGWQAAPVDLGDAMDAILPDNLGRWTETLTVDVKGMTSPQVIAAGTVSGAPLLGQPVGPGPSPGTFVASSPLVPGESYKVTVYAPEPSSTQLAIAGDAYPLPALQPELQLLLPPTRGTQVAQLPPQAIEFNPFGSPVPLEGYAGLTSHQALTQLKSSVYGRVYALARTLKASATTPYEYVQAVLKYLSHGFSYNETPPPSRYPLVSFLFEHRLGYCQQFAGAMALLLRMGGIPARVADGFATGRLDKASGQYVVSDLDAHAWVEAWFSGYGWVKFDPTPRSAPARGGQPPAGGSNAFDKPVPSSAAGAHGLGPTPGADSPRPGSPGSSGPVLAVAIVLAVLVVAALALARYLARRRAAAGEMLLAELERAFARCGRPLDGGVTLAELERRLSSSPGAARYVRAIRLGRFSSAGPAPTLEQRRALRAHLRAGLGALGWLRALLALPPGVPRGQG
jgi:transglutaminase-like putative cysteine protease